MAAVSESIEIDRPPAEVFEYVATADRRGEWQDAVRNVQVQTPDVLGVGMEVLENASGARRQEDISLACQPVRPTDRLGLSRDRQPAQCLCPHAFHAN